jgi:NitT/TauT family transport system permease protein
MESVALTVSAAEAEAPVPPLPRPAASARALNYLLPIGAGAIFLGAWEFLVAHYRIPRFVLPAPSLIARTLVVDGPSLLNSLWFTAQITLGAFCLALASGLLVGVLFNQSRIIEKTFWPYAVIMQVTPVVSIAPLIIIWVGLDRVWLALLILAWLVAFFPILSNTAIGLRSVDHGLSNLLEMYGAGRWKRFRHLQLPAALPYILSGVRISGGLSVIGAIVAEFVAGSGSATGLAWRIVESGNLLNIPRMFAALIMLSAFGICVWYATAFVQWLLLHRWHESEVEREN